MLDPDLTPGKFLVDQAADTFHTTTAGQTSNGRLGDALGVDLTNRNIAQINLRSG